MIWPSFDSVFDSGIGSRVRNLNREAGRDCLWTWGERGREGGMFLWGAKTFTGLGDKFLQIRRLRNALKDRAMTEAETELSNYLLNLTENPVSNS